MRTLGHVLVGMAGIALLLALVGPGCIVNMPPREEETEAVTPRPHPPGKAAPAPRPTPPSRARPAPAPRPTVRSKARPAPPPPPSKARELPPKPPRRRRGLKLPLLPPIPLPLP